MNAIIRWDPFRDLADVHGRLSSILGRPANGVRSQSEATTTSDWMPVVDIAENDHGFLLKIELPGVREDDVTVKLENRTLTVTGERRPELGEGVRYLLMERAQGKFARVFQLAEGVDPESVEARFKSGVLEIQVGRTAVAQPRIVQVKSD